MLELEVDHSDQECKENHDGYLADEAESNNSKVTPTVHTQDTGLITSKDIWR